MKHEPAELWMIATFVSCTLLMACLPFIVVGPPNWWPAPVPGAAPVAAVAALVVWTWYKCAKAR